MCSWPVSLLSSLTTSLATMSLCLSSTAIWTVVAGNHLAPFRQNAGIRIGARTTASPRSRRAAQGQLVRLPRPARAAPPSFAAISSPSPSPGARRPAPLRSSSLASTAAPYTRSPRRARQDELPFLRRRLRMLSPCWRCRQKNAPSIATTSPPIRSSLRASKNELPVHRLEGRPISSFAETSAMVR